MVLFSDRHWRSRLSVNACMCYHLAEPCRRSQMVPDNYNLDGKGLQTPSCRHAPASPSGYQHWVTTPLAQAKAAESPFQYSASPYCA